MPYPNEHSARIRDPKDFDSKTFRRSNGGRAVLPGAGLIDIPKSISIIWGKLKGSNGVNDMPVVQALRFPKEKWTVEEAKNWLEKNKIEYILFEAAVSNK